MTDICIPRIKANQLIHSLKIRDHIDIIKHLEDICAHKGAFVQYSDLKNAEGRLVVNNGEGIITVPENSRYPGRTRYSIGHELGHFDLHLKQKDYWECSSADITNWHEHKNNQNIELEANQYAAELLMPSHLVRNDITGSVPSFELAEVIHQKYQTSFTAASYKMIELTKFAAILVCFKDGRVSYIKRSKEAENMGLWPEHGKLDINTVASRMSSSHVHSGTLKAIYPESWFENPRRGIRVEEQAMFFKSLNFGLSLIVIR